MPASLCDELLGGIAESGHVVANHVMAKHSEYLRAGAFNHGHAREKGCSQVEWQDWSCRRRDICSIRGEDAIEIGNDDAEDAEEIELLLWRNGEDYPPHEQKTGNLGR